MYDIILTSANGAQVRMDRFYDAAPAIDAWTDLAVEVKRNNEILRNEGLNIHCLSGAVFSLVPIR